eukprot:g11958.t1
MGKCPRSRRSLHRESAQGCRRALVLRRLHADDGGARPTCRGLACFAMLSTAACSLFFITSVFHWSFGLMEAVSLIIFCGFSVDYPLHVVQAYVQERQKGAHIRHALREVGSAVASGCVTTCGAALFLLFCQIRIFTRFGQVLVVNMLCSLIFALLWIPAVLELCRPNVTPVSKDEEGFAMGLLGESAGSAGVSSSNSGGVVSRYWRVAFIECQLSPSTFSGLKGGLEAPKFF